MSEKLTIVPGENIEASILLIRGQKVILDSVLAGMYEVKTQVLNQAVKRNILRFPSDFMFQLSESEFRLLKSQFATSSLISQIVISKNRGGRQKLPYVFTEYGVAMLSSVLRSERAIAVNIEIMRTFGKLRRILSSHKDLIRRLDDLEQKYNTNFKVIFDAIRLLMEPTEENQKEVIGFSINK